MSSNTNLGALFYGDINILAGGSTTDFGFGDLSIARNVRVDGSTTSTSPTSGALVVTGGAGISENFYVDGVANLDQTNIVTDDGSFSVTGSNTIDFNVSAAISLDAAGASNFTTSSGNLTISTTSGTLIQAGSTAVTIDSSGGGVSIDGAGASNFNTTSGDLTIGADSGTLIQAGSTAVTIDSTGGGISLDAAGASNFTTSSGNLTLNTTSGTLIQAGSSGVTIDSSGGGISIDGNAASNFSVATTLDTQDLTIAVTGATDSSVLISSSGTSATDAIQLQTTAGGITLDANQSLYLDGASAVYINSALGTINVGDDNVNQDINVGTAGTRTIAVGSASATITADAGSGGISLDAAGASNFSSSSGTLTISTTGGAGSGELDILSNDTTNGIKIGTGTSGVPITIGHTTSEVTIADNLTVTGDLTVNGTTTTVDSVTLTVEDNIILVNSKPGALGTDAGVATKRYQNHNDAGTGDVVADSVVFQLTGTATISSSSTTVTGSGTAFTTEIQQYNQIIIDGQTKTVASITNDTTLTVNSAFSASKSGQLITSQHSSAFHNGSTDSGTAQGGTATTITLNDAANPNDDYYNGWWIKITGGTGANQVRRIKDYVGATQVATIYSTADETATPVTPAQGADFSTSPDSTSTYSLFPCPYIVAAFDESGDEFFVGCSGTDPATSGGVTITEYANIRVADANVAGDLYVDTINEYSSNHGVLIDGVLIKDGTITGTISGTAEVVNLTDNLSGTANRVELTSIATRGVYLILVQSQSSTGAVAMFAAASNADGSSGMVARLVNDKGADNENLNMIWNATEQPALYYQTSHSGGSGASVPYDLAITKI